MQQVLWPVDRLRKNSQQGKSLKLICCLSKQTSKTKEVFRVWSQGEVIDFKRASVGKKSEIVVMVKWDEEFV